MWPKPVNERSEVVLESCRPAESVSSDLAEWKIGAWDLPTPPELRERAIRSDELWKFLCQLFSKTSVRYPCIGQMTELEPNRQISNPPISVAIRPILKPLEVLKSCEFSLQLELKIILLQWNWFLVPICLYNGSDILDSERAKFPGLRTFGRLEKY